MCPKCGTGLLIQERIYDRWESDSYLTLTKCCNCGLYDDHLMQVNRRVSGSTWPVHRAKIR